MSEQARGVARACVCVCGVSMHAPCTRFLHGGTNGGSSLPVRAFFWSRRPVCALTVQACTPPVYRVESRTWHGFGWTA